MLQPTAGRPTVSVVVPARDEAATVGDVVRGCRTLVPTLVTEVVVVDDGSTDATATVAADAGARVVRATDVLPDEPAGRGPGKGQALWKGVAATSGEVVVFCDADLTDFDPGYVVGLVAALTGSPRAALAKGRYERGGTGGRVNELVARPVLELLHPELAGLAQPLGGEYAAWRAVLEQVPFVHGYGVEIGLVLDIARRHGPTSIVEADLAPRTHRNRSLEELAPQARTVLEVALQRCGALDAPTAECPPLCEVLGYARTTD